MKAVGALIISKKTNRVMMQLRGLAERHSMDWGLWGGRVEAGEGDLDAVKRELCEELGFPGVPQTLSMSHVYTFVSRDKQFRHVSYLILCEDEFVPTLDHESAGYAWVNLWEWPQPLHKNIGKMFNSRRFKEALKDLLDDANCH